MKLTKLPQEFEQAIPVFKESKQPGLMPTLWEEVSEIQS